MKLPAYKPLLNYRNKVNKSGRYPVHIRIYLGNKARYHPVEMPLNVSDHEWTDKEPAWIRNTHPYAFEINNTINDKLERLRNLNKRFFTARKKLHIAQVLKELNADYNPEIFNTYFENVIKDPPESFEPDTLNRYRAALHALNKFNPTVAFYELDEAFFMELQKYCIEQLHLKGSTIRGYYNAYKKVMGWARRNAHMTKEQEEGTLENVKIKVGKAKKAHLEVHQVKAWKDYVFPEKYAHYSRDRDMFLLLIYTGYYYSDLKSLLKTEMKRDPEFGPYLYSDRFKNDNLAIVPLWKFPKAIELIQQYADNDPDSPFLLSRDCFIFDQAFNRNLKVIAGPKMLNWNINIYNKMGRTTNSQLYIRFGAHRPIVSKMLGHEKEETTNAYFEINIADVIEGVRNVDFIKLGIAD